jgi:hypothetical protein
VRTSTGSGRQGRGASPERRKEDSMNKKQYHYNRHHLNRRENMRSMESMHHLK